MARRWSRLIPAMLFFAITALKQWVFLEKCFVRIAGKRIFIAEISVASQDFVITRWGA
jgi:hypothetical protein